MSMLPLGFSFKGREVNNQLDDAPSNMKLSTVNPISPGWSTHYHNISYNWWVEAGLEA